uniref:Cuticle protein 16.5-like n=1 Tax=Stomoxys calcitrans TaxID=35570 RepID=A0A1I8Q7M6_STOCA
MFKFAVVILAVIASASAKPGLISAPLAYTAPAAVVAAAPAPFVTATSSQVFARNYNGIATAPVVAPVARVAAPVVARAVAPVATAFAAPVVAKTFAAPVAATYAAAPVVAKYATPFAYAAPFAYSSPLAYAAAAPAPVV